MADEPVDDVRSAFSESVKILQYIKSLLDQGFGEVGGDGAHTFTVNQLMKDPKLSTGDFSSVLEEAKQEGVIFFHAPRMASEFFHVPIRFLKPKNEEAVLMCKQILRLGRKPSNKSEGVLRKVMLKDLTSDPRVRSLFGDLNITPLLELAKNKSYIRAGSLSDPNEIISLLPSDAMQDQSSRNTPESRGGTRTIMPLAKIGKIDSTSKFGLAHQAPTAIPPRTEDPPRTQDSSPSRAKPTSRGTKLAMDTLAKVGGIRAISRGTPDKRRPTRVSNKLRRDVETADYCAQAGSSALSLIMSTSATQTTSQTGGRVSAPIPKTYIAQLKSNIVMFRLRIFKILGLDVPDIERARTLRQIEEQTQLCDREEELLQAAWEQSIPGATDPRQLRLFRGDMDAYFKHLTEEINLSWQVAKGPRRGGSAGSAGATASAEANETTEKQLKDQLKLALESVGRLTAERSDLLGRIRQLEGELEAQTNLMESRQRAHNKHLKAYYKELLILKEQLYRTYKDRKFVSEQTELMNPWAETEEQDPDLVMPSLFANDQAKKLMQQQKLDAKGKEREMMEVVMALRAEINDRTAVLTKKDEIIRDKDEHIDDLNGQIIELLGQVNDLRETLRGERARIRVLEQESNGMWQRMQIKSAGSVATARLLEPGSRDSTASSRGKPLKVTPSGTPYVDDQDEEEEEDDEDETTSQLTTDRQSGGETKRGTKKSPKRSARKSTNKTTARGKPPRKSVVGHRPSLAPPRSGPGDLGTTPSGVDAETMAEQDQDEEEPDQYQDEEGTPSTQRTNEDMMSSQHSDRKQSSSGQGVVVTASETRTDPLSDKWRTVLQRVKETMDAEKARAEKEALERQERGQQEEAPEDSHRSSESSESKRKHLEESMAAEAESFMSMEQTASVRRALAGLPPDLDVESLRSAGFIPDLPILAQSPHIKTVADLEKALTGGIVDRTADSPSHKSPKLSVSAALCPTCGRPFMDDFSDMDKVSSKMVSMSQMSVGSAGGGRISEFGGGDDLGSRMGSMASLPRPGSQAGTRPGSQAGTRPLSEHGSERRTESRSSQKRQTHSREKPHRLDTGDGDLDLERHASSHHSGSRPGTVHSGSKHSGSPVHSEHSFRASSPSSRHSGGLGSAGSRGSQRSDPEGGSDLGPSVEELQAEIGVLREGQKHLKSEITSLELKCMDWESQYRDLTYNCDMLLQEYNQLRNEYNETLKAYQKDFRAEAAHAERTIPPPKEQPAIEMMMNELHKSLPPKFDPVIPKFDSEEVDHAMEATTEDDITSSPPLGPGSSPAGGPAGAGSPKGQAGGGRHKAGTMWRPPQSMRGTQTDPVAFLDMGGSREGGEAELSPERVLLNFVSPITDEDCPATAIVPREANRLGRDMFAFYNKIYSLLYQVTLLDTHFHVTYPRTLGNKSANDTMAYFKSRQRQLHMLSLSKMVSFFALFSELETALHALLESLQRSKREINRDKELGNELQRHRNNLAIILEEATKSFDKMALLRVAATLTGTGDEPPVNSAFQLSSTPIISGSGSASTSERPATTPGTGGGWSPGSTTGGQSTGSTTDGDMSIGPADTMMSVSPDRRTASSTPASVYGMGHPLKDRERAQFGAPDNTDIFNSVDVVSFAPTNMELASPSGTPSDGKRPIRKMKAMTPPSRGFTPPVQADGLVVRHAYTSSIPKTDELCIRPTTSHSPSRASTPILPRVVTPPAPGQPTGVTPSSPPEQPSLPPVVAPDHPKPSPMDASEDVPLAVVGISSNAVVKPSTEADPEAGGGSADEAMILSSGDESAEDKEAPVVDTKQGPKERSRGVSRTGTSPTAPGTPENKKAALIHEAIVKGKTLPARLLGSRGGKKRYSKSILVPNSSVAGQLIALTERLGASRRASSRHADTIPAAPPDPFEVFHTMVVKRKRSGQPFVYTPEDDDERFGITRPKKTVRQEDDSLANESIFPHAKAVESLKRAAHETDETGLVLAPASDFANFAHIEAELSPMQQSLDLFNNPSPNARRASVIAILPRASENVAYAPPWHNLHKKLEKQVTVPAPTAPGAIPPVPSERLTTSITISTGTVSARQNEGASVSSSRLPRISVV